MAFNLHIDYDRGVPVYRQIYDAITAALASGTLARDEQLPTIHELAKQLAINPNTVARAYRELDAAGYISTQRGKGTFPTDAPAALADKDGVLRSIYDRAVAEAARHGIGAPELVRYFRKVTP